MSTPPPAKRQKASDPNPSPVVVSVELPMPQISIAPRTPLDIIPPTITSPPNSRKRRASHSPKFDTLPPAKPPAIIEAHQPSTTNLSIPALLSAEETPKKQIKRTNTPWSQGEEQRLKEMRDGGNSWSEIAKAFPNRTEGSVKKHWYKDMHYADFGADDSVALREAIREYDANKWKAIGLKLGKPAKACEQFAKEHFKNM